VTDVYVAMVSWAHNVAPKGYYIAIVSTIAEGDSNHHLELQAGFERLGKIEEKFMGPPIPIYEPLESGENDNIFISRSYDATSHFETTTGTASRLRWTSEIYADKMTQTTSVTCTEEQRATSWWLRVCVRDRTWWPKSKRRSTEASNQQRECYNCSFFAR
jgi:RAB protein geranylgeranyltransferase component A